MTYYMGDGEARKRLVNDYMASFRECRLALDVDRPICCDRLMHRAGHAWSGRNRRQNWRCSQCGRKTIRPGGEVQPDVKAP